MKLKLTDLEIDRGKDVLTVAVPEHEIRVLQLVHGGDKVRPAQQQEGDIGTFDDSADAEYDRLTRKYYRVNAPDFVRMAFPTGAFGLEPYGFTVGRGAGTKAPAALVKKHRPVEEDKPAKGEGKAAK